jgi:hypothetical protein
MTSEASLQELRQIFKEEFGKELNQNELSEVANRLVGYFDLMAKICHRENTNETKTENK